jgi:ribosomal protein S8
MNLELSKVLFWDTNYSKINWDKNARYVIERVVSMGNLSDWQQIKKYYGMDTIKAEMLQSRDLDDKTISFLACIFNISKEEFRCYKLRQSLPQHWTY